MKNKAIKFIALTLCTVLVFGTAGPVVHAKAVGGSGEETVTGASVLEDLEGSKEETVYVLTDAAGALRKIIVSDWIQNTIGTEEEDAEKGLPIELSVTYQLNGETITPEELAGKSGSVRIRYDYSNKQFEDTKIDGKEEKIYVPFTVLTGMLLDNEKFTNVEVSNGKLVDDGSHTAVVGIAFPGLQEDLALDSEKLEIPDYVEIKADVKNFELDMTLTLVTNALFTEIDTDELTSIDDLNESLGKLTDAMDQLMGGSSQLYDGLNTLLDKSGELVGGIDKLAAGAKSLKDGVGNMDTGVSDLLAGAAQLCSGLDTIASNSDSLKGGAAQVFNSLLSAANTQLSAAGISAPTMTIQNYAEVLNGIIASLDENAVYEQALATVTAAVEEQRPYIAEQVKAAVRDGVTEQVTAAVKEQVKPQVTEVVYQEVEAQVILMATGMDKESYEAAVAAGQVEEETQAAIAGAIEEQKQSEAVIQMIEEKTAEQMASEELQSAIAANVEEQMQSGDIQELIAANTEAQVQKAISDNMASDAVQSQLAAASEGAKAVISLKTSLDSYNSFYLGLQSYTAGVAQAAAGAGDLKAGIDSLKDGSGRLYSGASELYDGILTLNDGAPALVDGVTRLRDGALRLSDGLKEFDEKGVQALVEAVDGDVDSLIERMRATADVSKNYQPFLNAEKDLDSQVKFIYRTDPIKIEK